MTRVVTRRPYRRLAGALLTVGVAMGCTTHAGVVALIKPRAAFDLACPEAQVDVQPLEGGGAGRGTYGAIGCGKRARYETQCSIAGDNCEIRAQSLGEPK
jgi:hypothetical protein